MPRSSTKTPQRARTATLARFAIWALVSAAIAVLLLRILDHLIAPYAGLVYAPGTTVRYTTSEFEFVAGINQLGFRGSDVEADRSPQSFRIAVLGDSFTYGWGVDLELTWPVVLADNLRDQGIATEVLNLGSAGTGPVEYARIAERSLERLRPDLVIVAVLQGDDLQQVQRPRYSLRPDRLPRQLFPNIMRILQPARFLEVSGVQKEWVLQAKLSLRMMSAEHKQRFGALDAELREMFHEGLVNPYGIDLAVRHPAYFLEALDDSSAHTRNGIDALARQLERIKAAAAEVDSQVLVVSVPYGIYVSDVYAEHNRRLGFATDPEMLTSTVPDESIAHAAQRAGLPHHFALEEFRESSELLYYALDLHFTTAGNRLFAEVLAPRVKQEVLNRRSGSDHQRRD